MNVIDVVEAQHQDAAAIAAIHLAARRQAMPYLRLAHTDVETGITLHEWSQAGRRCGGWFDTKVRLLLIC